LSGHSCHKKCDIFHREENFATKSVSNLSHATKLPQQKSHFEILDLKSGKPAEEHRKLIL
jgi:hypothetical protein